MSVGAHIQIEINTSTTMKAGAGNTIRRRSTSLMKPNTGHSILSILLQAPGQAEEDDEKNIVGCLPPPAGDTVPRY